MTTKEFTSNLRYLISQNKLSLVLSSLIDYLEVRESELYEEVILISNQFESYTRNVRMNLPVTEVSYNKIVHSTLLIVNRLDQRYNEVLDDDRFDDILAEVNLTRKSARKKKMFKYGVGFAGISLSTLLVFLVGFSTASLMFAVVVSIVLYFLIERA